MFKLNLHARIEIAAVVLLLLGSCAERPTREAVEIADVNARNALNRITDVESDVSDHEDRIAEIESRLNM